jgi:hypothetical protein
MGVRTEFAFPLWALGFEERTKPEQVIEVLVPAEFPPHGRCALFFSSAELAMKAASLEPSRQVLIEVGNFSFLLLLLEGLKNAGDTHVAIDVVFKEHGGPSANFYAIDAMLAACGFWFHIEND